MTAIRELSATRPASAIVPSHVAAALGLTGDASLSPAPQGMTSNVAFVEDRGRTLVLKHCSDPIYVEWLRRERHVLAALHASSLSVPGLAGYYEDARQRGSAEVWLLMTRLSGDSLWSVLLDCAPVDRPSHFRTLGNLLRTLHRTPVPAALRHDSPWEERRLTQAHRNLAWCDGSAELLARLEASRPSACRETLIHGDLALDNVLVDDTGAMSLIDWSEGDAGDPRSDIALALSTEPELRLEPDDLAAFFCGYGTDPPNAATLRWFVDLYEFF
jgi:aminoglycoside phosphotransferase (APT) family kinase protein